MSTWTRGHRTAESQSKSQAGRNLVCFIRGTKQLSAADVGVCCQLTNAYQELGKELYSTQIKVVGNYTLGRVIGEGMSFIGACKLVANELLMSRLLWVCTTRLE